MSNHIRIEKEKVKNVVDKLNILLSSYQIFYQNLRGFHWNIEGKHFFKLHEKYEEYYNILNERIDEIAERIRTLGFTPLHTYSDYLKYSTIKELSNVSDEEQSLQHTYNQFQEVLLQERELLKLATSSGDEGTVSLLSEYIAETEKILWMLGSSLK